MKKLKGYDEVKAFSGGQQLPKGGYVVKIMDCKEIEGNGYSYLAFSFDISEGEYKNHFANLYKNSTDENKKWRGIHNEFVPQENSQYYEQNLAKFKTIMTNFEESNKGYHWDWDEKDLKGKKIGIIYGEEEFLPDGKDEPIIITRPRWFASVETVESGKYKLPNLKKLKKSETSAIDDWEIVDTTEDDDLPF